MYNNLEVADSQNLDARHGSCVITFQVQFEPNLGFKIMLICFMFISVCLLMLMFIVVLYRISNLVSFFRVLIQQQIMIMYEYNRSGPKITVKNGNCYFKSSRDIEKVSRAA
jgi:hypothetical protein